MIAIVVSSFVELLIYLYELSARSRSYLFIRKSCLTFGVFCLNNAT